MSDLQRPRPPLQVPGKHHIIVSAENNCYMGWQCKLFHYSCVTYLGVTPVFIVHELDKDWHPYFQDIVAAGGVVRSARSYRTTSTGHDYSPRNTAGTLREAALIGYANNDFIVICDADLIFRRGLKFPERFASEGCTNLNYRDKRVRSAATKFGISLEVLMNRQHTVECAVPHVVPVACAAQLAETWLEAIDSFAPGVWQTSMYAFGFAVLKLGLKMSLTRFVALNDEPHEAVGRAKIIHYSYGDRNWNKRHYWYPKDAAKVWNADARAAPGTIMREIISQIRQANDFYGNGNHYAGADT